METTPLHSHSLTHTHFSACALCQLTEVDLYPEALQSTIDDTAAWVGPHINMAVYRCGFAPDQAAYDAGFKVRAGAPGV